MAQILPLATAETSQAGGFLARWSSGLCKTVTWARSAPSRDSLADAKDLTTRLVDDLLKGNHTEELNETNWTSFAAAVQRIVSDWSDKRRADLHKPAPAIDLSGSIKPDSPGVTHSG